MVRAILVCESWIDQGKKMPGGSTSTEMYTAQAMFSHSPLLRKGVKTFPKKSKAKAHDVPVAAFVDDVRRKLKLRKVMKSSEAMEPAPGMHRMLTKEDVNYRYAENPERSCGKCIHYLFPGACDMVAGLIRPVDVCNEFEAKDDPTRRQASPVVQAFFIDAKKEAEGGPGSGRHSGGKSIYAKAEPEGDDERQISTFTRREKPGERRARIKGKKVDPSQAKAIARAFLVVRASLISGEDEAMSTMGAHSAISDMPGSDAQDYTAPGLRHGRRGAA